MCVAHYSINGVCKFKGTSTTPYATLPHATQHIFMTSRYDYLQCSTTRRVLQDIFSVPNTTRMQASCPPPDTPQDLRDDHECTQKDAMRRTLGKELDSPDFEYPNIHCVL